MLTNKKIKYLFFFLTLFMVGKIKFLMSMLPAESTPGPQDFPGAQMPGTNAMESPPPLPPITVPPLPAPGAMPSPTTTPFQPLEMPQAQVEALPPTPMSPPPETTPSPTMGTTQPAIPGAMSVPSMSVDTTSQPEIVTLPPVKKSAEEEEIPEEDRKDIFLNFENTELSNFVNYMAEIKKINLIPDKTLAGVKVSLTIREALTIDGAWNVFLTVLEMSGFSIIKVGDIHVVMPKAQKGKQPLPAYINVPVESLPDSDESIRYVTFLSNISVNNIQELLKGMLSPEHVLVPYPDVNGMIITDKSYNIKAAMKVILELDQTGLQEAVVVMHLKRANATDVKTLFDSLIKKEERGSPLARLLGKQAESTLQYFSPTTRIIAEERTNSLILLGNKKSIKKIEDFIIKNIDTELKGIESPLHIYELQYTDASQIKEILETVTEPSTEKAKYGAVRGGIKYFKKMNFQVDKDGNRLIVSSTDKEDWKLLKKTIDDLDKPQPQVAIETLLVTVNITDKKELGGALRNKKEGQIGKGINFQSPTFAGVIQSGLTPGSSGAGQNNLLGNMIDGLTSGLGSTLLTFGKGENIWGIFKALKEQSNVSILSQPFFTVVNKKQAKISVGSTRNDIPKQSTGTGFTGFQSISVSTDITITPQINLDGIIRLNIMVNFSEFTDASVGNKNTKSLTSDVTVADGQVLALGGFIKTKVEEGSNKTPLLGDIPVLGWLFKNKKRDISKDYIFIFISPTIVKPRQEPGTNLYTRMKLHGARKYIEETVETKRTNDPIHNWFFNPEGEDYAHKVDDFANARYQPTTVDIRNDPYYRVHTEEYEQEKENTKEEVEENLFDKKAIAKQRDKLKKLISSSPIIPKGKKAKKFAIDKEKRKQFKDFLSEQPKVVNNSNGPEEKKISINKIDLNSIKEKLLTQNKTSLNQLNNRMKKRRSRMLTGRNRA